jgi:conjugal transfer pilus assembly protein TraE
MLGNMSVDRKKYASAVINSNYKASVWMWMVFFLLVSNTLLSLFLIKTDVSEKTIIIPPQFDQAFSIRGNEVSPEYISQMARYFSQLLLSYHPKNAMAQFDQVLRHTDPSSYQALKKKFSLDERRIERNQISSIFYLMNMNVDGKKAVIEGVLNGFIGSKLISQEQRSYQFDFEYNDRLQITGFHRLVKNAAGEVEIERDDKY